MAGGQSVTFPGMTSNALNACRPRWPRPSLAAKLQRPRQHARQAENSLVHRPMFHVKQPADS